MKRFFTILCAALMTLGTVNAEVLLKESFGQATETLSTSEDAFGNEIAASGWTNINGSGNIYMSSTNLSYSDYKSTADATGGSAEYKATFGKKVAQPLSKNINSGSIYAAAIMDISAVGGTGRDYNFALCTGTSSLATAANQFARINIRQGASSGFRIAVAKGAEANTLFLRWSDDLAFGTYLVVVEYQFVSGDNNDVVKLYMNPVKGDKPSPTLTCVQDTIRESDSRNFGASQVADASGLKSVMLYSSSSNKAAIRIDELKVVTDWSDLWESGGGTPTPTINVSTASLDLGNVTVGEAAMDHITVSGSNLDAAISVFPSGSDDIEVGTGSISIADATAVGGYSLSITVIAAVAGEGTATITLSSTGASNKVINVKWNAEEMVSKLSIAEAKLKSEGDLVTLKDVVVIREFEYSSTPCLTVQDATGALNLFYVNIWHVGDKISDLKGYVLNSDDFAEKFFTLQPASGTIAATGVSVDPFAVTLDDITKYGPALVKASSVSFADAGGKFATGNYSISQGSFSAQMKVLASCDIIDQDIPATANVTGLITQPLSTPFIQIRSKADVASGATGIESVQNSEVSCQKFIRNGQLVIIKDGKMFNVIGVEL